MQVIVVMNGTAEEVAALALAVQERHGMNIMLDSEKLGQEIVNALDSCGPIELELHQAEGK